MIDPQLKKLAIEANNETWKYLSQPELKPDEKVQILASAYSSLYLWARAGGDFVNLTRAHWLISRVLCVLEQKDLAIHQSKLCGSYLELAIRDGLAVKDFDKVYSVEAEARIAALMGNHAQAKSLKAKALGMAKDIVDPEDRQILEGDIRAEPWFGLA